MAIQFVQSNINVATSTTLTVALTGTGAGNTLIAHCFSNVQQGFSISDNVNGAWSARDANFSVAAPIGQGTISRFSNIAGGNITLTITVGTSATLRCVLQEYSGVLQAAPLDQNGANTNLSGSTTPATGATGALASSGELAVASCVLGNGETWTAGAGWTIDPTTGLVSRAYNAEYQINPNVVGVNGQFTVGASITWGALIATYIPAAGTDTLLGQGWV